MIGDSTGVSGVTYTNKNGQTIQVVKDGDETIVNRKNDNKYSIYSPDGSARTSIPLSNGYENMSIYTDEKGKFEGAIVLNDIKRDEPKLYTAKDCAPIDTFSAAVKISNDKNGNRIAAAYNQDGTLVKKTIFTKMNTGENVSVTQTDNKFGAYMDEHGNFIGFQFKGKGYYDVKPLPLDTESNK